MASAIAPPVVSIEQGRGGVAATAPLYEILDHLSALFESLEGLEDPQQRAECEADIARYLEAEIRKVDNIAHYLAFCEVQANFAQQEIKQLQDRKHLWQKRQERLEEHIKRVMTNAGRSQLEGRTNTLVLRSCPVSVEITELSAIPQEYITVTVEETPDKRAIAGALKAGEDVPGARLVTDKKSVVLR